MDFLCFIHAASIFEQKTHRTEEGFNLLVSLSKNMNSYRKDYSNFPPSHTMEGSQNYNPINGHFINGFIAGDGALYLRTKSNFGSMGIQISQHINNKPIIREIADYFNPYIKIYPHSKDSIQVTIGGKKLWKDVISHHFLTYLLHGTKEVRLAKLQEIASYLDSGAHLVRDGRTLVFKPEAKEYILKIWNT